MNRLVEHIHRDHGERDGVQAFAVHPVSCFISSFRFFEGLDFFFSLTSYTTSSSSSQGRSPHRRNKTAPRNAKWRHLVQRYVPTYPIPFLPSLPPSPQPYHISNNNNKTTELTDDETLCGGFLTWLTSEKRPWLSGRYLSATWDVNELELKKDEIVNENKLVMRMVI